jgi:hypothetical protein
MEALIGAITARPSMVAPKTLHLGCWCSQLWFSDCPDRPTNPSVHAVASNNNLRQLCFPGLNLPSPTHLMVASSRLTRLLLRKGLALRS